MGNAGSRPSCLGEKGQKSQDFLKDSYLKDLGLAPGNSTGRNNVEGRAPPPEKLLLSPVVIENGWNTGVGPGKGQHSGPLPKQNNTDIDVQNRSLGSNALKARLEAAWSPLAGLEPPRCSGSSWPAKPFAATEVTEVTEVTETVVTEIVEVTEYPGGDRSQQPVITRTVKVLSDSPGALPEVIRLLFGGQHWGRPLPPSRRWLGPLCFQPGKPGCPAGLLCNADRARCWLALKGVREVPDVR